MEIIDLDLISIEEVDGTAARKLHVAFASFYCANKISAQDWIALKVWLGLLPSIPMLKQRLNTDLAIGIIRSREDPTNCSYIIGAGMISSEMMRVFSLEEQDEILRRIE